MKKTFQAFNFSIVPHNASGKKTVDIYIDGDIVDASTQAIYKEWFGDDTSVSYRSFRNQLLSENADTYNIYINSGGGLLTDAMAMHDLLREFMSKGKEVNTYGQGLIASAATYILMAADKPKMSNNSFFMIHCVSGYAYGNVNEVEQQAQVLRQFNDKVAGFYANRTGLSLEDVNQMMTNETWMDATEAKQKGFIAEITNEATITNAITKENWPFANMAILNSYNAQVQKPAAPVENSNHTILEEMKKFFQSFKNDVVNAIMGAKPEVKEGATEEEKNTAIANCIAVTIGNAFDNSAAQFEAEADTHIDNRVSETLKNLGTNEVFLSAVKTAAENMIKDKGFITNEVFAPIKEEVAKIGTQQTGAASADSENRNNNTTNKKRLSGTYS